MNYLYTLYDALISIDVPADKARAVVDAMERDMTATLATKQDLDSQTILLRHDMEAGFMLLRKEMEAGTALLRRDMDAGNAALRKDMDAGNAALRKDMEAGDEKLLRDMEAGFAMLRQEDQAIRTDLGNDIRGLGLRIGALSADLTKELKLQSLRQTIRTGLMLYSGFALMFAAFKLLP